MELTGLVQAAQHNGKTGVFRGIDEENGRFVVELEEEDEVSIEHKDSTVMNMKLDNGFNNNTTNSRYQTKKELSLNSVGSSSNN